MEFSVQVYSNAFLTTAETNEWATALISRDMWEEIFRANTNHRLFLRFENSSGETVLCAVGSPTHDNEGTNHKVYLPYPILDRLGCTGEGDPFHVSVFTEEAFPPAEKITIRFIDSAAYNSDVKNELEKALTTMGVLQTNTQYQIPIEALGNYPVDIFVSNLEPADIVFCQGDEVRIEFEEPVDQITPPPPIVEPVEPQRPPTPVPPPPQMLGNVLGSDPTVAPPSWRQQIGPPRNRPQGR